MEIVYIVNTIVIMYRVSTNFSQYLPGAAILLQRSVILNPDQLRYILKLKLGTLVKHFMSLHNFNDQHNFLYEESWTFSNVTVMVKL